MPIYEYACEKCDKHLEIIQKITSDPLTICPDCKGQLRKMISNTSFVLKGTGWYVTDYASNKNNSAKTPVPSKQKDSTTTSAETTSSVKEPAASSK
jgi:putative FmdB family regulatory protein